MRMIIRMLLIFVAALMSVGRGSKPQKIIGGEIAGVCEFPFQVSIRLDNDHICGGAIIDNYHILTVAHCTLTNDNVFLNVKRLSISTGTNLHYNQGISQIHNVCRIIIHKDFRRTKSGSAFKVAHDIAILSLVTPIVINPAANRVNLPTSDTPQNTSVIFSGFGTVDCNKTRSNSQSLRKLDLMTMSNEECKKYYGVFIQPEHLCTSHPQGFCGSYGDSGSALVNENHTLVGVLTLGSPKVKWAPDIFNRVFFYLSWIERVLEYLKEVPNRSCRRSRAKRI